jgi:hypothetical protein
MPFVQKKDTQTVDESPAQSSQHNSSTAKVEGGQGSETPEENSHKEKELPEVQKEPDSTFGQSVTSAQEKMKLFLQNPQQCAELLQLYLDRKYFLTLLPSALRLSLVLRPSIGEEEVETPSEHSKSSGLRLQSRAPRDATLSYADLA